MKSRTSFDPLNLWHGCSETAVNVQADGITVDLDRPLKAIADDLGLTPEALSRALKQLQREEKINRRKRKVTLRKEFAKLDSNHRRFPISLINSKAT